MRKVREVCVGLESDGSGNMEKDGFKPQARDSQSLMIWASPDSMTRSRQPADSELPLRVLLAEDNPLDQLSIRRTLEKLGCDVSLAENGRRAVDLFEAGLFDLVLLDILMPEMDGFEVAAMVRANTQRSGDTIPIIALTAYSLKAVYDKCRSVGMNGYLSKPVSTGDLRRLRSVLLPKSAVSHHQ